MSASLLAQTRRAQVRELYSLATVPFNDGNVRARSPRVIGAFQSFKQCCEPAGVRTLGYCEWHHVRLRANLVTKQFRYSSQAPSRGRWGAEWQGHQPKCRGSRRGWRLVEQFREDLGASLMKATPRRLVLCGDDVFVLKP